MKLLSLCCLSHHENLFISSTPAEIFLPPQWHFVAALIAYSSGSASCVFGLQPFLEGEGRLVVLMRLRKWLWQTFPALSRRTVELTGTPSCPHHDPVHWGSHASRGDPTWDYWDALERGWRVSPPSNNVALHAQLMQTFHYNLYLLCYCSSYAGRFFFTFCIWWWCKVMMVE